jgi:glycosyltransferase involved in cell wall biosynthesis
MYKILHIAAHYGGGVGTIIRSWMNNDIKNKHCLTYLNDIRENQNGYSSLLNPEIIPDYDFVILHVWNHPSLYELLVRNELPECRMIGWAHCSGLHAPYIISNKLKSYCDDFYYTSPISSEKYVWSTCDVKDFLGIKKKEHSGFIVGYIGTLDFCKLHPDFIDICYDILQKIPDARFYIIGGGCDLDNIRIQANTRGILSKLTFTGLVSDIKSYLSIFDVFLYPLNSRHFGTCEQVLGEAMAAGVPCVTLNNPAERFITGDFGFGCSFQEDIAVTILHIKNNPLTQKEITESKNRAKNLYSIEKNISEWNKILDNLVNVKKNKKKWDGGGNILLESLGEEAGIFSEYIRVTKEIKRILSSNRQWSSENKGSIRQYLRYFPDDEYLKQWEAML